MNLPHVVLKNIGTGDEVGDVVDASTFRNFKALLDHGFIRAATAQEVAAWETSHAAPASAGSAVSSGDASPRAARGTAARAGSPPPPQFSG